MAALASHSAFNHHPYALRRPAAGLHEALRVTRYLNFTCSQLLNPSPFSLLSLSAPSWIQETRIQKTNQQALIAILEIKSRGSLGQRRLQLWPTHLFISSTTGYSVHLELSRPSVLSCRTLPLFVTASVIQRPGETRRVSWKKDVRLWLWDRP